MIKRVLTEGVTTALALFIFSSNKLYKNAVNELIRYNSDITRNSLLIVIYMSHLLKNTSRTRLFKDRRNKTVAW